MSPSHLEAALKAAAKAYTDQRRRAFAMPLEAAEISFLATSIGLSLDIAGKDQTHIVSGRRGSTMRIECDFERVETALLLLDAAERTKFMQRIDRELMAMTRKGRNGDPRYDINRHAALKRLSDTLGKLARKTGRQPISRTGDVE